MKEKGLIDKSNITDLVQNSNLKKKVLILAKKEELKADQGKVKAFDSSYFCSKSNFEVILIMQKLFNVLENL